MKRTFLSVAAAAVMFAGQASTPQAEYLDRGVVAVKTDEGVFVSWRSLARDGKETTFDVYRDGVKVNDTPITKVTNLTDPAGNAGSKYEVRAVTGTSVTDRGTCEAWATPYMKVHLDRPAGGTVKSPDGTNSSSYTYTPDDVSVGDVDGDGVYELFVKWMPSNAKDSSGKGLTGPTIIDCYRLDGTKLWRIDLGHNIRSGNHYTQFMVYDFDGDGCAEMICKTAPGTKDGKGNWVLLGNDKETDDYRMHVNEPAKILGHVRGGSEYLTCFSGKTGEALSTIPYRPAYNHVPENIWGDDYCNRADRYLGGVAYLDGLHPSVIMCRGYYRCAFVWAVDFKDGQLKEVWLHESKEKGKGLWGEGAHSLTIGDVDGDGKDEIVYGAACLDHDGKVLYRTNPNSDNTEGHGDALHLAKMLPDREGLQVFMSHEETEAHYPFDTEMRDARTGEIIYAKPQSGKDIGRGLAANVSAAFPGYEYWAASDANVYNMGQPIAANRPPINFRIYWDGDLLDELLDGTEVTKPEAYFSKINTVTSFAQWSNAAACNGTKNTPNLQADIMGDWREEVILHDGKTQSDLLIFTTTIPTGYKLPCLMEDHQYRMAIAWQNTAYNQPPHLSYSPEDSYETRSALLVRSGASSQLVNCGEAIAPITVTMLRATGIKAVDLPEGFAWDYNASTNEGILTGTPEKEGEYKITLVTTGAADNNDASMVITIKAVRPLALKPLAYFSCDKPGSTLTNHINGEAKAAGENVPVATEGKRGMAVELDGTNHYTQESYSDIVPGDRDFTLEFWMKSADNAAYIMHKGSNTRNEATGASGCWMGIELKNDVLYFAVDDDVTKSQAYVKEAARWFDNEWHHMVMVRDRYAKTLYIYADGVKVAEGEDKTGAIDDNNELLVIGNMNVLFDNPYTGALDEVYIYEGAMTAEKVAERYASAGKLLAHFSFDEIGYTTPNSVYGSAVAGDLAPVQADGVKGGAASFADGSYFRQEAYDAIQLGESDFTVEAWINSTDEDGYIFFKGSHAANESMKTTGHWMGLERKNGYLCFSIDDNVTKTDCKLADANAVFDGKWHHVACVRDFAGKTITLYIDGKQAVQTADKTGALADNNEPLLLGISDEAARPYDGLLDEFVIHPSALTPEEVLASYNSLAQSGIDDIMTGSTEARWMVVDAMSGRLIRSSVGLDSASLTDNVAPGVYIIVKTLGNSREVYKFVKR